MWTNKSLNHLAEALTAQGMPVSSQTVSRLLAAHHYSVQANHKRFEPGGDHPDRDQQFTCIAEQAQAFQSAGNRMISIDGKKKE